MILENGSLVLRSEGLGNIFAFLRSQHNAAKIRVDAKIVVEQTAILLQDLNGLSEYRPGLSVNTVAVSGCDDVRSSFMYGRICGAIRKKYFLQERDSRIT
jgi:hypothetical protein